MIFPDDDNGDVLRRMQAHGDDLNRPRVIDYVVVFTQEEPATTFAEELRSRGYEVTVQKTSTASELPWDVLVRKHMLPSYEGITAFEKELESLAEPHGGRNDGWGTFNQPFIS